MASKFPLRLTAGYAVMLTDAYQVPVIAVKSVYDNVTGFFSEAMRSRKTMPFNVRLLLLVDGDGVDVVQPLYFATRTSKCTSDFWQIIICVFLIYFKG